MLTHLLADAALAIQTTFFVAMWGRMGQPCGLAAGQGRCCPAGYPIIASLARETSTFHDSQSPRVGAIRQWVSPVPIVTRQVRSPTFLDPARQLLDSIVR